MSKRIIVLSAAIGPSLFMAIIACLSKQVELYTSSALAVYPRAIWMICAGVLTALYLTLPLNLYPKYGGRSLLWGAGIGILLALLLAVIGYGGFGIPLPVEPLTLLAMAGLSITGNLLCILRTAKLPKNAGAL